MKYINNLILLIFCLLLAMNLSAQDKVNKIYAFKEYSKAAKVLEAKENRSVEDMEKIANAYRLNHDTETAEFWYRQIIAQSKNPENIFHYAQALQSNGKLEAAKKYFLKYNKMIGTSTNDKRGERLAEAIDRLNEMKMPGKVIVENVDELNTAELEFSPSFVGDGLLFVSTRNQGNSRKFHDNWIDGNFMNLYHVNFDGDHAFQEIESYNTNLNSDYHEGPVAIVKSGKQMYFTRNQLKKNGHRENAKDGLLRNNIYTAFYEGGEWTNIQELALNTKEFEEVHPAISPDGETLVFSSDRSGGYGGMDLYRVQFHNGNYSNPENLGPNVNTAGNELFPYIHDDQSIYFASDGWGGIGGLDIFKTQLDDDGEEGMQPKNMGAPLNSNRDDFGLVMNIPGNEGYFTSARDGGHGKDDIYHFHVAEVSEEDLSTINVFCFFDESSGSRLANTKMQIFEISERNGLQSMMKYFKQEENNRDRPTYYIRPNNPEQEPVENLSSGIAGDFGVQLIKGREYLLRLTRSGYDDEEHTLSVNEAGIFNIDKCLPLKKSTCLTVAGTVFDADTKRPIPNATVDILESCLGDKLTVTADENGNYEAPCTICNCEYLVKGSKETYASGKETTGVITSKCNQGGSVKVDVYLEPKSKTSALSVGTSLELKNIFYDFDQYYIRNEAVNDLNELVRLLKKYPSMVIELSSHTDARGSHLYNSRLSQNRANAAVEYLIERGIEDYRLVAKGFGESRPRNGCGDGVKCSEQEHQFNRRTEVKILELTEEVDVKYIDNFPRIIDEAPRWIQSQD